MRNTAARGVIAAFSVALLLGACSTRMGGFSDPEPNVRPTGPAVSPGASVAPTGPVNAPVTLPAMTADGTQQFVVPGEGRGILRDTLVLRVQEPIASAQVSNAWRTAAGAQNNPNDYAACVSATSTSGTRYFLIVVSGNRTSGIVTGLQGQEKCLDRNRVVQWLPFPEATAS